MTDDIDLDITDVIDASQIEDALPDQPEPPKNAAVPLDEVEESGKLPEETEE